MAGNRTEIEELMQGLQRTDLRLYQILQAMSNDLQGLQDQINPIIVTVGVLSVPAAAPLPPGNFTVGPLVDIGVLRFRWLPTDELSRTYEIRKGTVWETASFVGRTSNLSFDADPIPVGIHDYLIKSINADGIYSLTATAQQCIIVPIGTIVVSAQVIDNNVLLRWNTPFTTWAIVHYEIVKDGTELIGIHTGNFAVIFEQVAGNYTYGIRARDAAGSLSDFGLVTVNVDQPPDFEFLIQMDWGASALRSYTNAKEFLDGTYIREFPVGVFELKQQIKAIAPVNITETWQSHFTSRGWTTPQAQITAGFPYFMEPGINGSGTITVEFFLDPVLPLGVIVNFDWVQTIITGNATISSTISWIAAGGGPYSTPVAGTSAFIPISVEQIRLIITIATVDTVSLVEIYNVFIHVDVKHENDGGIISALSTDATGTTVTFNKPFRDISSITGTAIVTEGVEVVIDFVDIPNPTTFKVYAFDYAGQRVSCPVRWAARGIV